MCSQFECKKSQLLATVALLQFTVLKTVVGLSGIKKIKAPIAPGIELNH